MSKYHKVITTLAFLFFAIFPMMILAGIDLTYESAVSKSTSVPSVKLEEPGNNVALNFAMAIMGVVLIVFGYLGLFIMLLKVPAKEIIGYESTHDGNKGDTINTTPNPIYSEKVTRITLPVWWLVKNRGIFSKIE